MLDKSRETHKSEFVYKIPFVEHEYLMYRVSRIKSRIVMALMLTNAVWLVILACILSKK